MSADLASPIGALITGCQGAAPTPPLSETQAGFTFALIGDLGYAPEEETSVDKVHADLNRNPSLAFAVHVGDLSAPRFSCTDELRERRRERGVAVTPAFEHFTRVEVFGSPYHHWVHVAVDPGDPEVLNFRPRLMEANLVRGLDHGSPLVRDGDLSLVLPTLALRSP